MRTLAPLTLEVERNRNAATRWSFQFDVILNNWICAIALLNNSVNTATSVRASLHPGRSEAEKELTRNHLQWFIAAMKGFPPNEPSK